MTIPIRLEVARKDDDPLEALLAFQKAKPAPAAPVAETRIDSIVNANRSSMSALQIDKELSNAGIGPDQVNAWLNRSRGDHTTATNATTPATAADPLEELLREQGIPLGGDPPPTPPSVRPDVASALPRNRPNARGDFQAATAEPGKQAAFVARGVTANVLNAAQGVPGVEAAEAGLMSLGSKLPWSKDPATGKHAAMGYRESLATLRNQTERIPKAIRMAEQVAGGGAGMLPLAKALSPAKTGMLIGGSGQAFNADPDQSMLERALRTAGGTVAGGVVGKTLDMATTGGKAVFAKNPEKNILQRQADRAGSARKLYAAARAEGHTNPVTPEIQAYLAEPEIAARVAGLKALDEFKLVADDSPEMLDALYKTLSDEAKQIGKGLAVQDPSKPNLGRFRERDVRAKKDRLLTALDTRQPSYREAVADFARHSGEINAVGRGMTASQNASSPKRPTFRQITAKEPKTPEAFAEWAKTAKPGEVQAAREGILGDTWEALKEPGKTLAPFRRATSKGSALLRSAPNKDQELTDLMQMLGLTTINANPFGDR